jgi:hypothetical protein
MSDPYQPPADPRRAIGDRLADLESAIPDVGERQAATRDLGHEMIQAGAEQELSPRLLANERPEEFTDADYAAYEAEAAADEPSAAMPAPDPE